MKNLLLLISMTLACGMLAAVNAQSVSGSIGNGTVTRGQATAGKVVLSIPSGLHVNSNRPNSEFSVATTVHLSGSGARISGVSYPRGANRKFNFSETPISVYQGRVSFPFRVTVPAGFKGSTITIRASVKFQACNEEACFPPKTREVTLTAKVR